MNYNSIARFFARYIGVIPEFTDDQQATYAMAQYIVITEPELAPYVLQVLAEGD